MKMYLTISLVIFLIFKINCQNPDICTGEECGENAIVPVLDNQNAPLMMKLDLSTANEKINKFIKDAVKRKTLPIKETVLNLEEEMDYFINETKRSLSGVIKMEVEKLLLERKDLDKMSIEVLVKNVFRETGEGPHWDEDSQTLYFVDNLAKQLFRWNYQTNVLDTIQLAHAVTFVIPRKKGGLVIGYGKTVSSINLNTKEISTIVEVDQNVDTRVNDGKCDPKGRLWFGTMGVDRFPEMPLPGEGSMYSLDVDGTVTKHMDKIWISNGFAWSSDNRSMYYIDSLPGKLYGFDYDVESGATSNRRVVVDFEAIGILGLPDGMAIDTEDKIWVACYNGAKVVRFDPETGKQLQTIEFPAKRITSCCFGGDNYDELFVTSARSGAKDIELNYYPLSGSLFRVKNLGAKGSRPTIFLG